MNTTDTHPAGPTLSRAYNATLAYWAAAGHDAEPICEDCEADLTGKPAVAHDLGWFCEDCAAKRDGEFAVDEAAAERRQMGLTES